MLDAANPWNTDKPYDFSSSWLASAHYARILNRRMTGDPDLHWFEHACRTCLDGRDVRSLLLFSTEAGWELALRQRGYTGRIVVVDIAERALARGRARAQEQGFTDIEYRACDLNTYRFSDRFDLIIAEGILHHIERLDFCLDGLAACLNPSGRLVAMEFTGAYRFQFPPIQVGWINAALAAMPKRYRPFPQDEPNAPPSHKELARIFYVPPSIDDMIRMDPSEAISGHLLHDALMRRFKPLEVKRGGGSIVMNIGGHFPFASIDIDPDCRRWFDVIVAIEEAAIEQGLINSDLAFYVLESAH